MKLIIIALALLAGFMFQNGALHLGWLEWHPSALKGWALIIGGIIIGGIIWIGLALATAWRKD